MQAPNSRLILIGIANSIDLTERALPRLQATGCRPTLVTFPSYSSLQLECLLQQRLQALPGPVFQPQAVRLAAKKVRDCKALDVPEIIFFIMGSLT